LAKYPISPTKLSETVCKITFATIPTDVAKKKQEPEGMHLMRKMNCTAFLALLAISMIGRLAFAQNPPALLVVPSKATMLVGDTRTFRAVGKDGRKQQNVNRECLT
jgi:hypothetical protein